jgi:hypothetical protein
MTAGEERRTSAVELLWDLVFVFAVFVTGLAIPGAFTGRAPSARRTRVGNQMSWRLLLETLRGDPGPCSRGTAGPVSPRATDVKHL